MPKLRILDQPILMCVLFAGLAYNVGLGRWHGVVGQIGVTIILEYYLRRGPIE